MTSIDAFRTIDAIWRIESAKIIGGLVRMVGDLQMAEDVAQDTLVIALERWPETGIPNKPGAWLMAVAKRRAIDLIRRDQLRKRKYEALSQEWGAHDEADPAETADGDVGDDLLCLIFSTCHPILSQDARVALTLRLFGGLTTKEIAHAYLVPTPTIAQRITRAKRTLAAANVTFEVPGQEQLSSRLASVLEVIYLMFNEGYVASSGESWARPLLCEEALRLGRVVAEIIPAQSEVHGLVSLMEIQASRLNARMGAAGEPILLMEQNRANWDHLLIRRGLAALERAERCGGTFGPYALQAAIAACHARARHATETDWVRIAALYDALSQVAPSPIVELNRAVALAMAFGPAVGLEIVEAIIRDGSLKDYYLLHSVYADLLCKLGRNEEAAGQFKRAAKLTKNARERELLLNRALACLGRPANE